MRIAMVGTGYVGLVSGVCFSEFGHEVVCVDRDAVKIARLSRGEVPIYEPGLEAMLGRNMAEGRLSFATDLGAAVAGAEAVFIAVGTPSRRGDGHADLSHVHAAAREIAQAAAGPSVVVTKSTVPVGTNREVARILREERPELDWAVASNPEFLREGAAIEDFLRPDRIVVGLDGEARGEARGEAGREGRSAAGSAAGSGSGSGSGAGRARAVMAEIYRPLALRDLPIVWTDLESAEMIKYAANAFLATKITFINEVAALCEKVGADVKAVARGMGLDGRIGPKFLHAGPGYGGSCFPKDTRAFAQTGRDHGAPLRLTEAVIDVNEQVKARMVGKIAALCGDRLAGRTVAVLGVTFKPNTDDMREAPALAIVPALVGAGAKVRIVDPQGRREGERLLPGAHWAEDPYRAAEGADLVVLLTEWNQFRGLDLHRLARAMAEPRMADLRNVYSPEEAKAAGFTHYDSVGRPGFGPSPA